MEDEWEASEEGVVPEGAEEMPVYAEVFKDRERAQAGGTTFKTASDTTVKAVRTAAARFGILDSTIDNCIDIIKHWPNHQIYNPEAMLYAALFMNYSSDRKLTKETYSKFLANLSKAGTASKALGEKVKHADVIRYIKFFVVDEGRRGIDMHPF